MWGIDRIGGGQLSTTRKRLRSNGVALLTHAAAVDWRGRHIQTVLEELGVHPRVMFAPEHGISGVAQAQVAVDSKVDDQNESAPVISLYGKDKDSLTPQPEHFDGVELLLIDLVDVGSRYYTYVWTALMAARAAEAKGIHTLVLDRPNPISGDPELIEGRPQQEGFLSFVGLEPVPIRHSLTLGEILVHFFKRDGKALGPDGALSVVSPLGWERLAMASAWARPFIPPSPNMPTLETALVYPGGCLVEGTNLSEGRGTTLPFQTVGAPFLDGPALAEKLQEAGLPGVQIRPVAFCPTFDKFKDQVCNGVMLHVTEPRSFRPVTTYLTLLTLARQQTPEQFAFSKDAYEFETSIPAFDLLTGSAAARTAIEEGASHFDVVEMVAPVEKTHKELVLELEQSVRSEAQA